MGDGFWQLSWETNILPFFISFFQFFSASIHSRIYRVNIYKLISRFFFSFASLFMFLVSLWGRVKTKVLQIFKLKTYNYRNETTFQRQREWARWRQVGGIYRRNIEKIRVGSAGCILKLTGPELLRFWLHFTN